MLAVHTCVFQGFMFGDKAKQIHLSWVYSSQDLLIKDDLLTLPLGFVGLGVLT